MDRIWTLERERPRNPLITGPFMWWRWGESNPRPKNLHPRYYMLSQLFG